MLINPFIIPIIIVLLIFIIPMKSKFSYYINLSIIGLYTLLLFVRVSWPEYGSYYLKFLYVIIYLLLGLIFKNKTKELPTTFNLSKFAKGMRVLQLASIMILSTLLIYHFYSYIKVDTPTINLSFPLKKGKFFIGDGGSKMINSHQSLLEKNGIDIVKLDNWGRIWKGSSLSYPINLRDYYIYRDTIFSPCEGTIINYYDAFPDHEAGSKSFFLKSKVNFIEILTKDANHVILLHIAQNSSFVKIGEHISEGFPMALVGNSGVSKFPHLHLHAFHAKNKEYSESMHILFKGKNLVTNDTFNH